MLDSTGVLYVPSFAKSLLLPVPLMALFWWACCKLSCFQHKVPSLIAKVHCSKIHGSFKGRPNAFLWLMVRVKGARDDASFHTSYSYGI